MQRLPELTHMLLSKDENIKTSPSYIGYLILQRLKGGKKEQVMIYEVIEWLREDLDLINYRQMLYALVFLYEAGIIDFAEPYIYTKS